MKISTVATLVLTVLAGACTRQDVKVAKEGEGAAPSGDWPTYGGPLAGDRYSPLAQITAANVGRLRQLCAFDAPDVVNFQSGIVAVNGVLYFTVFNNTYAVDGATCQQTVEAHPRRAQHVSDGEPWRRLQRRPGVSRHRRRARGGASTRLTDDSCGTSPSATRRAASRRRWRRSRGTASCSPGTRAATTSG